MDTETQITEEKPVRMCCDCGIRPVKPQRNAKRPFCRCDECHRRYKREEMRRRRDKKKDQVLDNPELGMKRCTKCRKMKWYSAYSPRANSMSGELNLICDACLTKIYMSQNKHIVDMTAEWWRGRAYCVNNVERQRQSKKLGVPVSSIPMDSLVWKCGPNDLVKLFKEQHEKCVYCGVQLTRANLAVDHKIPVSREGAHSVENLCLCCKDCNTLKLARTNEEFDEFLPEYAQRIINRYRDKELGGNKK